MAQKWRKGYWYHGMRHSPFFHALGACAIAQPLPSRAATRPKSCGDAWIIVLDPRVTYDELLGSIGTALNSPIVGSVIRSEMSAGARARAYSGDLWRAKGCGTRASRRDEGARRAAAFARARLVGVGGRSLETFTLPSLSVLFSLLRCP